MNAYFDGLRRYVDFTGRSTRAQFGQFVLVVVVQLLLATFIDQIFDLQVGLSRNVLGFAVGAVHFLPFLAISVRRLHDSDRSGWWYLVNAIPFGVVIFVVLVCIPSTPGTNNYGPPVDADAPGASLNRSTPHSLARRHLEPLIDGHWQQPPKQVEPAAPPIHTPDLGDTAVIERLEKLESLRASGTIDEAEFKTMKAAVLKVNAS